MERLKHIVELNIALGVWLLVAPFGMGYSMSRVALANDVALGMLLIGCSWWILSASIGHLGASTLQLIGAVWLVAAPFLLHYPWLSRAFDNDIGIGVLSVLLSATATSMFVARSRRLI